jgi:soluble P-type ATPase
LIHLIIDPFDEACPVIAKPNLENRTKNLEHRTRSPRQEGELIEVDIPGGGRRRFHHLVLDVNGTLARDGHLLPGVEELLSSLKNLVSVHLVTADTHGAQKEIDQKLSITAHRIPTADQAEAKSRFIQDLDPEMVVAVGNGANDALMLEEAGLGIAVIGPEGAAAKALLHSDVIASDITDALELLLHPKRLLATLRR